MRHTVANLKVIAFSRRGYKLTWDDRITIQRAAKEILRLQDVDKRRRAIVRRLRLRISQLVGAMTPYRSYNSAGEGE